MNAPSPDYIRELERKFHAKRLAVEGMKFDGCYLTALSPAEIQTLINYALCYLVDLEDDGK